MEDAQKKAAYQALIEDVRKTYQRQLGGLSWCEDCQEINLWTYWQGRGNWNPRIMLVGQDWGCPGEAEASMENIRRMNAGEQVPYMQGNKNPTDLNLIRLFRKIGYDITSNEEKNKDLFFTNFVLGYRAKGISGGFLKEWAKQDAPFFARLVDILEPEVILCLGKDTFQGVMTAFPGVEVPKVQSYNHFLESEYNPVTVCLPSQKWVRIFALAHCGKLGTLNRNREEREKTSLDKQIEDWKKILL